MKAKTIIVVAIMVMIATDAWTQNASKPKGHPFRLQKNGKKEINNVDKSVIIAGLDNTDPAKRIFTAPEKIIYNDYAENIDRYGRDFTGREVTDILQNETVEISASEMILGETLLDSIEVHYTTLSRGVYGIGQKKRLPYPGEIFDAIPLGNERYGLVLSRRCFNTAYAIVQFKQKSPPYVPPAIPDTLPNYKGGGNIINSFNTTTYNYGGGITERIVEGQSYQQQVPMMRQGMMPQVMPMMPQRRPAPQQYAQSQPPRGYFNPRPHPQPGRPDPRPEPRPDPVGQGPAGIEPRPQAGGGSNQNPMGQGPAGIQPRGQRQSQPQFAPRQGQQRQFSQRSAPQRQMAPRSYGGGRQMSMRGSGGGGRRR